MDLDFLTFASITHPDFLFRVNRSKSLALRSLAGQLIRRDQVKALASMPSLNVLRATVVRQAMGPGSRIVSMAAGPARRLAGAIAALVEKLEKQSAA